MYLGLNNFKIKAELKKVRWEFPLWLRRLRTWLVVSMRTQVQSLASLSQLRIQRCHKLWCRLQMRLGSQVAVAMVEANSWRSDLTPCLETFIYLKRKKREREGKMIGKRSICVFKCLWSCCKTERETPLSCSLGEKMPHELGSPPDLHIPPSAEFTRISFMQQNTTDPPDAAPPDCCHGCCCLCLSSREDNVCAVVVWDEWAGDVRSCYFYILCPSWEMCRLLFSEF